MTAPAPRICAPNADSGIRTVTGNVASENRVYTTKHGTPATMNTANIGAASKPDQERMTGAK